MSLERKVSIGKHFLDSVREQHRTGQNYCYCLFTFSTKNKLEVMLSGAQARRLAWISGADMLAYFEPVPSLAGLEVGPS